MSDLERRQREHVFSTWTAQKSATSVALPLVVTEAELAEGLSRLGAAFDETMERNP